MFHDRSLAKLLPTFALAALAFCFAPVALAQFPDEITDPGAPPSDFPDHSGELFNFGSTFEYSFSEGENGFAPRVVAGCITCIFPVNTIDAHTITFTGQVLGRIRGNDGAIVQSSRRVYDLVDFKVEGVRAEVSDPTDPDGDGIFEQNITYTALLTGTTPFNGRVSGKLVVNEAATQKFFPGTIPAVPLEGSTITVGAQVGPDTPGLVTADGPSQTFKADVTALGRPIAANVVLQVTEKKRLKLPPVLE